MRLRKCVYHRVGVYVCVRVSHVHIVCILYDLRDSLSRPVISRVSHYTEISDTVDQKSALSLSSRIDFTMFRFIIFSPFSLFFIKYASILRRFKSPLSHPKWYRQSSKMHAQVHSIHALSLSFNIHIVTKCMENCVSSLHPSTRVRAHSSHTLFSIL